MRDSTLLGELVGKRLWTCRRAGDMATFQFGKEMSVSDYYGRPAEIGEYALHIQCAWRLVQDESVLVASGDLYYPADYDDRNSVPEDFNWDRHPNRRDRLLRDIVGNEGLVVRLADMGAAGLCHVGFENRMSLQIFPDNSLGDEHWRLFATEVGGRQLVVTGR